MRYVLAPRPNSALFAQDYFVYELSEIPGYQLLKNLHDNNYITLSARPELIVSHNPDQLADARFIRHWGGEVPLVIHLHYHYRYFEENDRISNREHIRECLRYASVVVVPHGFLIDDLRANVPDLRTNINFIVVSNGARKSLYYPSRLSERNKFKKGITKLFDIRQIPLERKIIGFVGRLENKKGLQILQALVDKCTNEDILKDSCLLIQFPYWHGVKKREDYRRTAEALRQKNRDLVWFFPDQGPRLSNRPMRNFDILFVPSLSEVQPMVVLEALSSGVPVVTTQSTRFLRDLSEKLGFEKTECRTIPLPAIFDEGAACRDFGERGPQWTPDDNLLNNVVEALKAIPVYTDEQRINLAAKAESAGFSDTKMYAEYLRIYDEAVADFGKK
jgi:glycosyltransferase involved in cell wall biosynthesis